MSDLVGYPEARFSHNEAQIIDRSKAIFSMLLFIGVNSGAVSTFCSWSLLTFNLSISERSTFSTRINFFIIEIGFYGLSRLFHSFATESKIKCDA